MRKSLVMLCLNSLSCQSISKQVCLPIAVAQLPQRNLVQQVLQSSTIGANSAQLFSLLDSKITTLLASISISMPWICSRIQRVSPSLIAHSTVSRLFAHPVALVNPFTHLPRQSLIMPPPPAIPGQPSTTLCLIYFEYDLNYEHDFIIIIIIIIEGKLIIIQELAFSNTIGDI